ncbi:MAG: hypothetical protein C0624_09055 [Desulfuromonas sp.]|nr:MAG: hypothetical protein C0624_09055 [Desulfuromonas sp.]
MQKRMVVWLMVLAFVVISVPVAAAGWQKIDAKGVKEMMDHEDPLVVFPLSRIEYNNLHIEGSVNIPLYQLEASLPADKNRKMVFYCLGTKCTASPLAADMAVELGYKNVYAFIEGLPGWIKAGYSTKTIERLPLASIQSISPEALKEKLAQNPQMVLIDIRPDDVSNVRIDHPRYQVIPLDDLITRLDEIPRDAEVAIVCQKGKRGPTAVRYLAGKGFSNISCLRGGVKGWQDAGLPILKR